MRSCRPPFQVTCQVNVSSLTSLSEIWIQGIISFLKRGVLPTNTRHSYVYMHICRWRILGGPHTKYLPFFNLISLLAFFSRSVFCGFFRSDGICSRRPPWSVGAHSFIYMCDMTHSCVGHAAFIHVTWRILAWNMTNFSPTLRQHRAPSPHPPPSRHVWCLTHSYVTWLIHMWRDSIACDVTLAHSCVTVTCLIHMWHDSFICDMTHSYVIWLVCMWRDSFICDMTHSRVWHVSFICDMTHSFVTWLIHMWYDSFVCDMTHSYVIWLIHVWPDSFIRDTTHAFATGLFHMQHDAFICDVTHSYVTWLIHIWHDSFLRDMTHLYDMPHSYITWLIHTWHTWHDVFICYHQSHIDKLATFSLITLVIKTPPLSYTACLNTLFCVWSETYSTWRRQWQAYELPHFLLFYVPHVSAHTCK